MKILSNFQESKTLEERTAECTNILEKHKDRVPIIVEKLPKCDLPDLDKKKYLAPRSSNSGEVMTFGQFTTVIRKRLRLKSYEALFFFVGDNSTIPMMAAPLVEVYSEHKNEDGFLYVYYATENTFGSA